MMEAPMPRAMKQRRPVATPAKTRKLVSAAVEAATAAGVKVGGIEIAPDGTIRILRQQPASAAPGDAYDAWKAGPGA